MSHVSPPLLTSGRFTDAPSNDDGLTVLSSARSRSPSPHQCTVKVSLVTEPCQQEGRPTRIPSLALPNNQRRHSSIRYSSHEGQRQQGQRQRRFTSRVDRDEAERLERMEQTLTKSSPPWGSKYIKNTLPMVAAFVESAGPHVWMCATRLHELLRRFPIQAVELITGLSICFFGGRYMVSIAAFEAFKASGGDQSILWCADIWDEIVKFIEASAEDDEDSDFIEELEMCGLLSTRYATRKTLLWLRVVDPEKIRTALSGLWSGYMGVLVAVNYEFAATTALAYSIADHLRAPAGKVFGPTLLYTLPDAYHHWVNPCVNMACKTLAGSVAWMIRSRIAVMQSALKGGSIVAYICCQWLMQGNITLKVGDDTILVDLFGWLIAALGIRTQLGGSQLYRFPFTLLLYPLDVLEAWLKFSIIWFLKRHKRVELDRLTA